MQSDDGILEKIRQELVERAMESDFFFEEKVLKKSRKLDSEINNYNLQKQKIKETMFS